MSAIIGPRSVEERIIMEIRALLKSAASSLETRRDHPSYGITKASIAEKLTLAEGALRVMAMAEDRLDMLSLSTSMLERQSEVDPLYELAGMRIRIAHELKAA